MEEHTSEPEEDDSRYHIEFYLDDLEPQSLTPQAQTLLKYAVAAALRYEQVQHAEISVAVVTGLQMRKLNQQYLQHDYDTDVLSFCLETQEDLGFLLGQLIVSVDFAQQQATRLSQVAGKSIRWQDELALYLVHGTLHLLGYDDHEVEDRQAMRRMETEVLATLGIVPLWPPDSEDSKSDLAADRATSASHAEPQP